MSESESRFKRALSSPLLGYFGYLREPNGLPKHDRLAFQLLGVDRVVSDSTRVK